MTDALPDPDSETPDPSLAGEATLLLRRMRGGDDQAAEELLQVIYAELHRLAKRAMARQGEGHTLQATALLNEAWIRMAPQEGSDWNDRQHFLAVAARAMRSVLVDRARRRNALKRSGEAGERIELDQAIDVLEQSSQGLCELDEALEELSQLDERLTRVVELRFFAGLKHPDIAELLGISLRSVERDWSTAKAWLHTRLASEA